MRKLFILALAATLMVPAASFAGKCTGSKNCTACKNCRYCKHCAKQGGSCGVCNPPAKKKK